MHVSYWCVLAAALLPFAFTAIAKGIGRREFTNRAPRVFQSKLTGMAARAHWAHLNSFEAFPPFAAAVLIAQQLTNLRVRRPVAPKFERPGQRVVASREARLALSFEAR